MNLSMGICASIGNPERIMPYGITLARSTVEWSLPQPLLLAVAAGKVRRRAHEVT